MVRSGSEAHQHVRTNWSPGRDGHGRWSPGLGLYDLGGVRSFHDRVVVGPERAVVRGWANANHLSGKASFMQLSFAESFMSAFGERAPRVVLVSYSEQFDSRYYPERLRTVRSVDGGKTFTPLATGVAISSMTRLANGSLVAVDFRTTKPTTAGLSQRTTNAHPDRGQLR
jgi:hypothetical protein